MMRAAWSASSAAPPTEAASTSMLATRLSSSSRTAGSPTVVSTFTTSTPGTSSGRSPAGASPVGHAAARGSKSIEPRGASGSKAGYRRSSGENPKTEPLHSTGAQAKPVYKLSAGRPVAQRDDAPLLSRPTTRQVRGVDDDREGDGEEATEMCARHPRRRSSVPGDARTGTAWENRTRNHLCVVMEHPLKPQRGAARPRGQIRRRRARARGRCREGARKRRLLRAGQCLRLPRMQFSSGRPAQPRQDQAASSPLVRHRYPGCHRPRGGSYAAGACTIAWALTLTVPRSAKRSVPIRTLTSTRSAPDTRANSTLDRP